MADPSQIVGLHRQPSNGQHQSLAASFTCPQSLPSAAFVWLLTMPTMPVLQDIYEKQSNLYRNTLSSKQRFATLQENEETFIPPQDLKVIRTLGEGSFASGQRQAMGAFKGHLFPCGIHTAGAPLLDRSAAAAAWHTCKPRLQQTGRCLCVVLPLGSRTALGAITGLHLPQAACLAWLVLISSCVTTACHQQEGTYAVGECSACFHADS